MQVDIKRATPKVVEEISQRITPIVENEAKYTLVRSHRGAYSQEYLYVTQHEERITSLVLWSEDAETLSIVELKGNIQLDNVDEIANALKVKGLDRLAYINTPTDQVASGSDFIKKLEERFGIKRDSIFGKDPFGSFRESFGSMDDMLKKAEEMFRDMGPMFSGESDMDGMGESISNGLEVIQENGKTRIKVNAKNSEVSYVIDGIEYAADSLKNGIPRRNRHREHDYLPDECQKIIRGNQHETEKRTIYQLCQRRAEIQVRQTGIHVKSRETGRAGTSYQQPSNKTIQY